MLGEELRVLWSSWTPARVLTTESDGEARGLPSWEEKGLRWLMGPMGAGAAKRQVRTDLEGRSVMMSKIAGWLLCRSPRELTSELTFKAFLL